MLRELSIRELTDIEMDMVSGGEGDEIVVTGTRHRSQDPAWQLAYMNMARMQAEAGMAAMMANIASQLVGQGYGTPAPAPAPPPPPPPPPPTLGDLSTDAFERGLECARLHPNNQEAAVKCVYQ